MFARADERVGRTSSRVAELRGAAFLVRGGIPTAAAGLGTYDGRAGYVEGQNLVAETRYAEGRFERLPELAAELVSLLCDVIVAAVTQASLAARDATATSPSVMIGVADPVTAGLVATPRRPR